MEFREQLAEFLYQTYCEAVGGVAYDGKQLPTWAEFVKDPAKTKQAQAWGAVSDIVLDTFHEEPKLYRCRSCSKLIADDFRLRDHLEEHATAAHAWTMMKVKSEFEDLDED